MFTNDGMIDPVKYSNFVINEYETEPINELDQA